MSTATTSSNVADNIATVSMDELHASPVVSRPSSPIPNTTAPGLQGPDSTTAVLPGSAKKIKMLPAEGMDALASAAARMGGDSSSPPKPQLTNNIAAQTNLSTDIAAASGDGPKLDEHGLILACERGSLKNVRVILESQPEYYRDVNKVFGGSYGTTTTALLRASEKGRNNVVKFLVEELHAQVNRCDLSGYTPLMKASFSGHVSTAQYLMEKGADIHVKSSIHENTAVFYAAISGEVDAVKCLIEKGAEFNLQNKEGETPLMKAVDFGHVSIVEYFLRIGADVFKTTTKGKVALDFARSKDIRLLLQLRMKDVMIRQSMTPSPHLDTTNLLNRSSSDAMSTSIDNLSMSAKRNRVQLAAASVDSMRNVLPRQSALSSASSANLPNNSAGIAAALNFTKNMTPNQQMEILQAASRLGLIPTSNVSNASPAAVSAAPAASASATMAKLIEERVAQAKAPSTAANVAAAATSQAIDFRSLYEQEVVKRMCLESQIQVFEHERVRIADVLSRFFLLQQANCLGIATPVEQQRLLESQLQQYLGISLNMMPSCNTAAPAQLNTPPSATASASASASAASAAAAGIDVGMINHLSSLLHKKS